MALKCYDAVAPAPVVTRLLCWRFSFGLETLSGLLHLFHQWIVTVLQTRFSVSLSTGTGVGGRNGSLLCLPLQLK